MAKKSLANFSTRKYKLIYFGEGSLDTYEERFGLAEEVSNDDFEYKYALADEIDKILSLSVGQTMYFMANRDNENSKGVIVRIS